MGMDIMVNLKAFGSSVQCTRTLMAKPHPLEFWLRDEQWGHRVKPPALHPAVFSTLTTGKTLKFKAMISSFESGSNPHFCILDELVHVNDF